jgi:hypothetical protein
MDFDIEVQYQARYQSQNKVLRYRSLGTSIQPNIRISKSMLQYRSLARFQMCGLGIRALPSSCPSRSHCLLVFDFFFVLNSFKSSIQVCWPQCRVTINCKLFTMVSIEGIYQLLIVSYVLASGHDLVTPLGSSESTGPSMNLPHSQGSSVT